MDDCQLLREYIEHQSEQAFSELVARHVNLVYATALRLVNDSQTAQDVAQSVFIQLARNARSLRDGNALPGWLYRTTCRIASNHIRTERRRREREAEAMNRADLESDSQPAWESILPVLDEAIARLSRTDQDAIVLRFLEQKSLRETGLSLEMTEQAARKRVGRALEKLRSHFAKRGIPISSAVIVAALTAQSAQAAPVGLAASLAGSSLALATSATATGLGAILKALLMTKTKLTIISLIAATAVVTPVGWHVYSNSRPDAWLKRFETAYRLRGNETVRLMTPPYMPERLRYYQEKNAGQASHIKEAPNYFIFRQKQQELTEWGLGFTGQETTLDTVLRQVCQLNRFEFEALPELLRLPVNGDWTIRDGANPDSLLQAIQPLLRKATKRNLKFEKRTVEREVVVVSGSFATSKQPLHIYAENSKDTGAGGASGNMRQLLDWVGDRLNLRFVDETSASENTHLEWRNHYDSSFSRMGNRRAELTEKVLKNLQTQTGLSFHRERRPVEIWFISAE